MFSFIGQRLLLYGLGGTLIGLTALGLYIRKELKESSRVRGVVKSERTISDCIKECSGPEECNTCGD